MGGGVVLSDPARSYACIYVCAKLSMPNTSVRNEKALCPVLHGAAELFLKFTKQEPKSTKMATNPAEPVLDATEAIDLAGALRSYAGHKGWCTKNLNKASECMKLVEKQYARETERSLESFLQKAEEQVAFMSQYTDWLEQAKYAKVADHKAEVADFDLRVQQLYIAFLEWRNKRAAEAAGQAPQQQAGAQGNATTPSVKPVSDLKPQQLQAEASTSDLRQWKRQFEAYYSASNMSSARIMDQQAYLEACLDKELAKSLARQSTGTTPIFGENASCMTILDGIFNRRYPLLLRRRQYFNMSQQQGQDERSFLENVLAMAEVADIVRMDYESAVCVVILGGARDSKLKEKLSEVENPTVREFTRIIDSHMHARASTSTGHANATKQNQQKQGGKPNSQSNRGNRPPVSEKEKTRRAALYGKCFRCAAADHTVRDCKKPRQVECLRCKEKGHTAAACGQTVTSRAVDSQQQQQQQQQQHRQDQLALTYGGEEAGWAAEANALSIHQANRPTPAMLL